MTVTDVDGRRSSVEPLVPAVGIGTLVTAGARLGTLVAEGSHCAPSACLHWGVRVGDDYVDPLGLLAGAGPAVLLPLDPRVSSVGPRRQRSENVATVGASTGGRIGPRAAVRRSNGRPADVSRLGPASGRRPAGRIGQARSASTRRVRSRTIAAVCICEMRDSVTPRTRPISASVMPS